MKLNNNDTYHTLYAEEANEQIIQIERLCIQLETDEGTPILIQELFRLAHSLKGASATLALEDLVELAHLLESIFEEKRSMKVDSLSEHTSLIFKSIDTIKLLLSSLFSSKTTLDQEAIQQKIKALKEEFSDLKKIGSSQDNSK